MTESANQAVNLFKAFATDSKREEEGVLTVLPDCGPTKFLIARLNNFSYQQLLAKLAKRHKIVLDSKSPAAKKKSDEILAEVYAETILLGWEGELPNAEGTMQVYSKKFARELLSLPDFRAKVQEAAEDMNLFLKNQEEEAEGNSVTG